MNWYPHNYILLQSLQIYNEGRPFFMLPKLQERFGLIFGWKRGKLEKHLQEIRISYQTIFVQTTKI